MAGPGFTEPSILSGSVNEYRPTGYGWEGIRQVCATLLGARHVPEHLCGEPCLQKGAITSARPLPFYHLRKALWATKSEGVALTVRAVSFEDFQPMLS